MNRFVSVLLAALCLAALSLAQPAQAQSQWLQGRLYYDENNTAILDDDGDTILTTKPLGMITLTSEPKAHGGYENAYGNANGGLIHQEYLWIGYPDPPGTSFTSIDTMIVYGNYTSSSGSARSSAGGFYGGAGYNQSYSGTNSTGPQLWPFPGNTSTTVTRTYSLGASTAAPYTGSATAAATIIFGPPS